MTTLHSFIYLQGITISFKDVNFYAKIFLILYKQDLVITTQLTILPSIDVLKGIKKFSNYTRSQLLDITDEDLDILEQEATEAVARSIQMNNDTKTNLEQKYLELQQEMQDFNYNMTLKKQNISEAQEAVRNPSNKRRRKRNTG